MKLVESDTIAEKIADLYWHININQRKEIKRYFKSLNPKNKTQKFIIDNLMKNADNAKRYNIPLCQDTGIPIVFIDKPNDYFIKGDLQQALKKAFKRITKMGLRNAILNNPFEKGKFNWNEPFFYIIPTKRKRMRIVVMAKGAGAENVTISAMLNPSLNTESVIDFIIDAVKKADSKACPPYIMGVCIGGSSDFGSLESQKILTGYYAYNKKEIEKSIAKSVIKKGNKLKIGIQGLNFGKTILDCRVKVLPSHIASLSINISFQCYHNRVGFLTI